LYINSLNCQARYDHIVITYLYYMLSYKYELVCTNIKVAKVLISISGQMILYSGTVSDFKKTPTYNGP